MTFQPPSNVNDLLVARYFQPGENWETMCRRVARAAASSELSDKEKWEESFYQLMVSGKALPNTPALINAGTGRKGSISACFVQQPEDSMESIMEVATSAAMILKFGGGCGFEMSKLRPAGSTVNSTHKYAMGPIGVLSLYNKVGDTVTQAGVRKAALLGALRIDHPDIIRFIHCKEKDGDLANFNISVTIPDSFMKRLAKEPEKPHLCSFGGRQYHVLPDGESVLKADRGSKEVLSVGDIWQAICDHAAINGDPGILFLDTINRDNPLIDGLSDLENPQYIHGSNPCAEQGLCHNGSCNLASVDLAKFVVGTELDIDGLQTIFEMTTRLLDDLIDSSAWPTQGIVDQTLLTRRIGVGVMGFTSMLDKLGIRYGSDECMKLIDTIGVLRESACSKASKALGEERGPYPLARKGDRHRNVARTTVAPTGSLAMLANTSWSIEPHTYWAFTERRNDTERFRYLPTIEEIFTPEQLREMEDASSGDLAKLNLEIQNRLPKHMVLSRDLTAEEHLKVVAAWQRYTDSGVSKTVCAPQDILTSEKVDEIFRWSWENKIKGLTVYPEGSREGEPMSIKKNGKKPKWIHLPEELEAKRFKVEFDLNGKPTKAFAMVGMHPEDKNRPVEVFLKHPHEDDLTAVQFIDLTTRLISLCLRYSHCQVCGKETLPLGQILKQLDEADGQNMYSVPKIFMQVLGKFIAEDEPIGTCKVCGGNLVLHGKCSQCLHCGWSKCG
jgi:ribonucleoside-diphosphate reductase alpha chain